MTVARDNNATARTRRRGKRSDVANFPQDDSLAALAIHNDVLIRSGRGDPNGANVLRGALQKTPKDVIHHHPPKEMAADVGFPVRGGQTLLIAYFPWEASETDIEREFCKFCRVKRVHLVVDKSSRKPRCFGFVKFMSKVDAEEALRATTQGLVQLPDTRGHVWHLKAEWTRSGDMVVDDSETEQEVAKRKEERRYRAEQRTGATVPGMDGASHVSHPKDGKWPGLQPKGALHPGVPAPLPPLQARYPTVSAPLGLQGQVPLMQHGQNNVGLVSGLNANVPPPSGPLAHQGHAQQMVSPHQSHHQGHGLAHQALYGGVAGGVQQGVPVYNGQQGQAVYSGQQAPPYYNGLLNGVTPQLPRDVGNVGMSSPSQPVGGTAQESAGVGSLSQTALRDIMSSYGSAPQGYMANQQSYTASQQSYVTQHQGFPPPPQGYVGGQQGYAAGQQPYPAGQQPYHGSQQTFAGAQNYASSQPGYSPPQSGYSHQQRGYSPQPQQGLTHQGYGSPPGYPSQPQGYAPPGSSYSSGQHPSYPGYNVGQPLVPPAISSQSQHGTGQQGHFGLLQHASATHSASGVVTYGNYHGGAPSSSGAQHHTFSHQGEEGNQESGSVAVPAAGGSAAAPSAPTLHAHYPQSCTSQPSTGGMGVAAPSSQPATSNVPIPHAATGGVDASPNPQASQAATGGSDTEYLDMVWSLSEMSLHDKSLPAPPAQQPPAPPSGCSTSSQWQTEAFRTGAVPTAPAPGAVPTPSEWDAPRVSGTSVAPTASGPAALWNSFDDAAAKGMVDGLVGGEDGTAPPAVGWTTHTA